MDNYHITKSGDKWTLTKEGNERPSKTAETKQEIIDKTREFMNDKTGSVKIHKEDGKFQEERTYHRKDDPSDSKG
ncbi:DUF2188 domain-containing protein [Pseudomonas chlororaphis]|uniref:DUF2188 domain-containing protein n=1 Tax=Pseudomonas chlororaphis TaxID=587753 RepID=UPI000F5589E5|nr:DUF2188 domain-containing protein [Pseudomonas chlororaphis]AZD50560.1 hypothetical protein C4K20_5169 [Pseudomonas chlororaphis subsp. aurantiaca]